MAPPPTPEELAARRAAEQHAAEQAAHAAAQQLAAQQLAAQQAADQAREAAAQRIAAQEEALRQATERVAAQEAANLQAAEMIAAEKLRMERSLIEPMEVDTSLVFPLPQGTVAQIDFGSSWKTLTGYFDGKAKTSTEVLTLIRNFEQCVTSGNWTQHMAINNFSQILTGTARTWMELLQAYNPRKAKKWDVFKEAFLAEFQSVKNESEAHEQFAKLFQGKNETTRDFSYRVKQTVAVIRKYKAEIPAGATEIQRTVAMMQKQRVEDEINQYFMNGLRPEIKSEMTKQKTNTTSVGRIKFHIALTWNITVRSTPSNLRSLFPTKKSSKSLLKKCWIKNSSKYRDPGTTLQSSASRRKMAHGDQ